MIRNLKLLLISLLSLGVFCFAAVPTAAAFTLFGDACQGNEGATVCQDARRTDNPLYGPGSAAQLVVNILSIIIGIAAVIIIIVAGIQYMLSTGDPTKVNNAKNAILYAAVGLVIAVAARSIIVFVLNKL
jgi:hypothetical protein